MATVLDAALGYTRLGFKVVAVLGKKPEWLGPGWHHLATTDERQIREWYKLQPKANVGICPDGTFAVLDIDYHKGGGETIAALEREHGPLPLTVMSVTGGGGTHQYYRIRQGREVRYKPGPGIEFKAKGQLVEWPSLHPDTGKMYEWAEGQGPHEMQMADCPEWLYRPEFTPEPPKTNGKHPTDSSKEAYCRAALSNARRELSGMREGGRNDALNRMALGLAHLAHYGAFSEDEAMAALMAACQANGLWAEDGPRACENTFRSGWKAGLAQPKEISDRERPRSTRTNSRGDRRPEPPPIGEEPGHADPPEFITAAELEQKTFKPVHWVIEGILPSGLAIIAGKSKIGKSWLVLDFAICVAAGLPAFTSITTYHSPVLYLALEDNQRRLQSRMRSLLGADHAPNDLVYVTKWRTLDDGGLDDIEQWVLRNPGCKLVIIDTFAKVRGQPDGRKGIYQQDYSDIAPLKMLADRLDICILLVHHTRKMDASDVFDLVSGSTGIVGAADSLLVLERKRSELIGKLSVTGRDIKDDGEYAVKFDKDTGKWSWMGDAGKVEADTVKAAIYNFLLAVDSATPKEISLETGASQKYVTKVLNRLKREGKIEKLSRGLWQVAGKVAPSSNT